MAGASGFLGTRLQARLASAGHEIVQLVRRTPTTPDQRQWWPDQGRVSTAELAGADAVVNLAGAGVTDQRWTDAYRTMLRTSRVEPTATLAQAIAGLPASSRPALLNASAVGYYGDTGEMAVDEDSPGGSGFLAGVARDWEAATEPAADAGARVVRMRTGFPLDAGGGMLKPLLLPFRLGVGGKLGNGRQWLPWLSMRDWLSAVEFLLANDEIAGPVNLVGPGPVRNSEFARVLGHVLRRPAIVPIPAFALRIAIGEFANEALVSQRVLPAALSRRGFTFQDTTVESALRSTMD